MKNNVFKWAVMLLISMATTVKADTLAVIVHPENALQSLDKADLALIFMRKKLYFASGQRIVPINLPANHSNRKAFSTFVFGDLPESQSDYWNEAYYHGLRPPFMLNSIEAVLKFVEITPNAIAYVDACKVTASVKSIAWIEGDKNILGHAPELNCTRP